MRSDNPIIFQKENSFRANYKGSCISDCTIIKEAVYKYYTAKGGTILRIPDHFGLAEVGKVGDLRFENVSYYWIKNGQLCQFRFNRFWIFGSNDSSLFTVEKARTQAAHEFIPHLISKNVGEILADRDAEKKVKIDLTKEVGKVKQEYCSLLSRVNIDEPEMQDFLEKHLFILNPLYLDYARKTLTIRPQDQLGERVVDFLMVRSLHIESMEERIDMVEIKKPSSSLFSPTGASDQLREAISQLVTSFEWLERNPDELKISDRGNVYGMVIIGRRNELQQYFENKDASLDIQKIKSPFIAELESFMGKWKSQIMLLTFDDLLPNIEFVERFASKVIRYPVIIVGQEGKEEDFTGADGKTIQEAIDYLSKILDEKAKNSGIP